MREHRKTSSSFYNRTTALILIITSLLLNFAAYAQEVEEGSIDAPQNQNEKNSLTVKGEYINIRTGAIHWETTDISLPGPAGFNIDINRSWNKTPTLSHSSFSSWELEIPRIEMNADEGGDTFGSKSGKMCSKPQSLTSVPHTEWVTDPPTTTWVTECGYVNHFDFSTGKTTQTYECNVVPKTVPGQYHMVTTYSYIDHFTGLTLVIPGEMPKPLLMKMTAWGSDHPSYPAKTPKYVTEDNWLVKCSIATNGVDENGFIVTSPEGKTFNLTIIGKEKTRPFTGGSGNIRAYASSVEDRFGNRLTYNYTMHSSNKGKWDSAISRPLLDSIVSNDGRKVEFNYNTNATPFIDKIKVNNTVWQYNYSVDSLYLETVVLPDNSTWKYINAGPEYRSINSQSSSVDALKKRKILSEVKSPTNLRVQYLKFIDLNEKTFCIKWCRFPARDILNNRKVLDGNLVLENLSFDYTIANDRNITTISGSKQLQYKYSRDSLLLGSLNSVTTFDSSLNPLQVVTNNWEAGVKLGTLKGHKFLDNASEYRRILKSTVIQRPDITTPGDGFVTTYLDYNDLGKPRKIQERGIGGRTRVKDLTYFDKTTYDTDGKWRVGVVKNVSISEGETLVGFTTRTFNDQGELDTLVKLGIPESFEYYATGDLKKRKYRHTASGPEFSTTYSNYKLGKAQLEENPEDINVSRVVNDWGLLDSETNGEGKTISYKYDSVGQLSSKIIPGQSEQVIEWFSPTSNRLTQGSRVKDTLYNAYGKIVEISEYSVDFPADKVYQKKEYDNLGRLIFDSRKYSPPFKTYKTMPTTTMYGVAYTYDNLDRVVDKWDTSKPTEISHYYYGKAWNAIKSSDDPAVNFGYGMTDGRGFKKVIELSAYGNPDEFLMTNLADQVSKKEGATLSHYMNTALKYDVLDNIKKITVGGQDRILEYYPSQPQLLKSESNPETGLTQYTYDLQGNLKTSQVGASNLITYFYDGLNRMTSIDYPTGTLDVVKRYYKTGDLKSISNGVSTWIYKYNDAGQITSENLSLYGESFSLEHRFNDLGHKKADVYPNGDLVEYAPNVFGLPTKVGKYISNARYYANGYFESYIYKNGHKSSFLINDTGFPSRMISTNPKDPNSSGALNDKSYHYDARGNVTSIDDQVVPNNSISMTLDGVSRLVSAQSNIWGGSGVFTYDDLGNIKSRSFGGQQKTYTYTPNNKLESISGEYTFGYDSYGNVSSNGKNTFRYDDAGHLLNVSSAPLINYEYDANNRRVLVTKQIGNTHEDYYSFFDQSGKLIYRYEPITGFKTNYIYLGKTLVATNFDCSSLDSDRDGIPDCVEEDWGLNKNNSKDAMLDLDADGVANLYEYAFDSNPKKNYSNNQGLSDSAFINLDINGAFSGDLDADGLTDLQEFRLNTNPLSSDTDGDGMIDSQDSAPLYNLNYLIPILYLLSN